MVRMLGTPAHRAAQPAFAALAMARRSEFEGRMLAILDPHQDRHPLSRRGVLMSSLAALLLVVPLAALSPFRSAAPSIAEHGAMRDSTPGATTPAARTSPADAEGRVAHTVSAPGTPAASTTPVASPASAPGKDTASVLASCDRMPRRTGQSSRHVRTSTGDNDEPHVLEYSVITDERCVESQLLGVVRFTADESDVASVSETGRALFRERTDAIDRMVIVTSDGGELRRVYRVDGASAPLDAEGRAWMARMIREMIREAAIDAKPRVRRLRESGGARGVLSEVERIKSPSAKRAYLEALLEGGGLSADELELVTVRATRDLGSSSGDLASVLRRIPSSATRSPSARSAVTNALARVDSDGDRRVVLQTLAPTADRELLIALARSSHDIRSDGDKRAFLQSAASYYLAANDGRLREAFFAAVATIGSDGDQRALLTSVLPFARSNPAIALAVIRSVESTMSSDGDKATVLVAAAEHGLLATPAVREAYMDAASRMESSSSARRVLTAALEKQTRSY
jgi:hypothetical protein